MVVRPQKCKGIYVAEIGLEPALITPYLRRRHGPIAVLYWLQTTKEALMDKLIIFAGLLCILVALRG